MRYVFPDGKIAIVPAYTTFALNQTPNYPVISDEYREFLKNEISEIDNDLHRGHRGH